MNPTILKFLKLTPSSIRLEVFWAILIKWNNDEELKENTPASLIKLL